MNLVGTTLGVYLLLMAGVFVMQRSLLYPAARQVRVCIGTGCTAKGSLHVLEQFRRALARRCRRDGGGDIRRPRVGLTQLRRELG